MEHSSDANEKYNRLESKVVELLEHKKKENELLGQITDIIGEHKAPVEETPAEEAAQEEAAQEAPVEETPAEEAAQEEAVQEAPVEETPAEEAAQEEAAQEEAAQEAPVEETPAEEAAQEEAAQEEAVQEAPVEETPAEEAAQEEAAQEEAVQEAPVEETPAEEAAQEEAAQEEAAQEAPVEETPAEEAAQEEAVQEAPVEETPAEEAAQEEAAQEEAVQEAPVEETPAEEAAQEAAVEEPQEAASPVEVHEHHEAREATPEQEEKADEIVQEAADEAAREESPVGEDVPVTQSEEPVYVTDRDYLVQRGEPKKVEEWKPLEHDQDGSEDEFDQATCMAPVYAQEEEAEQNAEFQNGEPSVKGEVLSCFEEPHLLYRIINREENTWAFYNDSLKYEVHVEFTFGRRSKVEPLGNTTMAQNEKGEFVTRVVVYPTETEMFVKGTVNGFTSKLRAAALSEDYHMSRNKVATKTIEEEENAIREACGENKNAEEVLKVCIEKNIPFVDPEFPPCQASLDTGAKKPFKTLAWARPKMYLPEELIDQVRLFRGPVKPSSVDAGVLGDSWVICAITAIADTPSRITGMFRHPEGKEEAKKERAVGAYRVTLCQDGQWRSVVVDDYLPISAGKPKYAKSATDPAEIWPCILEKAFAKLHGSYARICIGDPLHALSDMTGFPTYRFDDGLKAASEGDDNLFQDLVRSASAGYTIICSTPGKDPRRCTGGEDAELCDKYRKLGLSTGYAYNILDVKDFPEIETRLVKVRNAVHVDYTWNGEWNAECEKWNEHPEVAEACHFEKADVSSFWMPWKDALNYFDGGGMCFTRPTAFDYRVPCHFDGGVPSVVLEVEVKEPTWMSLVVSQADRRGRENVEYQAAMITISQKEEHSETFQVLQNSSANALRPSNEKWTFLRSRDVCLVDKLEAGKYLIIPRIYHVGEESSDTAFAVFNINANHDLNGAVTLKRIEKDCRVFDNFPTFVPELTAVDEEGEKALTHRTL